MQPVDTQPAKDYRSGFVGIIGRPNVGKSSILNALLGHTVAIVSPKPQTTRHRILGVLTRPDAQVMFLDSPGFHRPQHVLGRYMLQAMKAILEEADLLMVVIDGHAGLTIEDYRLFEHIRHKKCPCLAVINKIDLVQKLRLLPLLEACAQTGLFVEHIPVSARTQEQMDLLLTRTIAHLPTGPQWYPPHQWTDQTDLQLISECIRQRVLFATQQEVPHAVSVQVDQIERQEDVTTVTATIFVERPGQKVILIGKGGAMLKRITQGARRQIKTLLGWKIRLRLWVKVAEDWRNNPRLLNQMGYGGSFLRP